MTYATTSWTIGDVKTLAPQLSDEQAEEFLYNNGKYIQEAVVSAGWTAIESLLTYEGIEVNPDQDEEEEEEEDGDE